MVDVIDVETGKRLTEAAIDGNLIHTEQRDDCIPDSATQKNVTVDLSKWAGRKVYLRCIVLTWYRNYGSPIAERSFVVYPNNENGEIDPAKRAVPDVIH
jgi:hypothetical protein